MKRVLLIALCAVMLTSMIVVSASASGTTQTMYVYSANGKTVNLRSNPYKSATNVIMQVPFGAKVSMDILFGAPEGWSHITYNGKSGWMMTQYLSTTKKPKPNPTPSTPSTPSGSVANLYKQFVFITEPYTVTVAPRGAYVNLRWAPSKSAAVQSYLTAGATLKVLADNGTWLQVEDETTGAVGFIMKIYTK